MSFLFLVLVGLFAWLIWRVFFAPRVFVACLPVVEYELHLVPPAPFGHQDFEALANVRDVDLANLSTHEGMKTLSKRLNGIVSNSKDTLILYLSAHGVSLDGKGYLLCSDFAKQGADSGRFPISDLLKQLSDCQAGEKILILDAGHLPTRPHLGVLVNEFPRLLAEAVRATHDERLWVLTANSMHESSHVSHDRRQSVFNYFVVRGLSGDADVNPRDKSVDLAELVTFVGCGVSDWVDSQSRDRERQTPAILWGGGGEPASLAERMRRIHLRLAAKKGDAKQAGEEPLPAEIPQNGSKTVTASGAIGTEGLAIFHGGTLIGRLPPVLMAASTAALAQPTAADSTTDKKAPPEPPSTTSASPATKDGENASPKPVPTESDPKSASGVQPAEPTGSVKAEKLPADQAAPAPAQSKEEVPSQTAGKGGNDKLSSLRKAWKDRDQRLLRSGAGRWCPLDYAPHLWREFEDRILDDESSLRTDVEELPNWSNSVDAKLRSSMDQAVSAAIRGALQDRNDYFDRAVDITAWHARAACGTRDTHPLYNKIESFLRELARFDGLLEKTVSQRNSEEGVKELANRQQALGSSWEPIGQGLIDIAADAVRVPAGPGAARTIEDLLSTPLLGSEARIKLLAALSLTGAGIERSQAAKKIAEGQPLDLLESLRARAEEQAAPSAPAWQRAIEQARLEMLLVGLADPEIAAELEKLLSPAAGANEVPTLGKDLARYYGGLPAKIREVTGTSDPRALRRADRRLRLLPASDAVQFAGEANPIPWLKWSPPPASDLEFEGFDPSHQLALDPGGWKDLKSLLKVQGTAPSRVKIALRYNPSQLEVESADDTIPSRPNQESKPLTVDADRPLELNFRIRPIRRQQKAADFSVVAIGDAALDNGAKEAIWTVKCAVPPPDDVELVISPADDFPNEALISQTEPGHQRLSTFPGHETSFMFRLKHQSSRPRKVRVELRAVAEADQATIRNLGEMADKDPRELASAGGVSLSVKEMTLPASGESVPIEFTPFPPQPPPPKEGAAPVPPPKEPPLKPSIDGGLICVISDLERKDLGPWGTWIEISPWAPKDYVEPTVNYADQELTIDLKLIESIPQDGEPIRVSWDLPREIPRDRVVRSNVDLGKENKYSGQLKAHVDRDRDKQVEIRLGVDGYPRAFVYKVPRNANQLNIERERGLKAIEIVEPKPETAKKVDGASAVKVPALVRVSAPDDAFPRGGEGDRVEVWIDNEGDTTLDKLLWTRFTDRQVDVRLDKLGADGRVAIGTQVTDFHAEIACDQLNGRFNLIPQLVLRDTTLQGTPVPVIFDRSPPTVASVDVKKHEVSQGELVLLSVTAQDGLNGSGIKSIKFVDDTDGDGKIDDEQRKAAEKTEVKVSDKSGVFTLQWKTQDSDALGTHALLVWATDKAGWESSDEPYLVEITIKAKPAADPAGQSPAAAKAQLGAVKGQVTYGGPAAKVTVTLDGGKKTAKTDDNGEFVFKDLPPGDYKFEAKGIVKNSTRKGTGAVTIPTPPPRQPIPLTIKLE